MKKAFVTFTDGKRIYTSIKKLGKDLYAAKPLTLCQGHIWCPVEEKDGELKEVYK